MNAREVLTRAADRLRTQGWCRRTIGPKHGSSCLIGAVLWELDDVEDSLERADMLEDAVRAIQDVLRELGHISDWTRKSIINWNDRQLSVEPVLEVLALASQRVPIAAHQVGDTA